MLANIAIAYLALGSVFGGWMLADRHGARWQLGDIPTFILFAIFWLPILLFVRRR